MGWTKGNEWKRVQFYVQFGDQVIDVLLEDKEQTGEKGKLREVGRQKEGLRNETNQ